MSPDETSGILKRMNPWWENKEWYKLDKDYSERVREGPFEHRWFRIIDRAVQNFFDGYGIYDVLILAGPRRSGKTSMIKKLIERNQSKDPRSFIYVVLDDYELRKIINEKGLKKILLEIVKEKSDQPVIIIVDEASAIEEWDIHIKNIIDSFTRENIRFLLIVTGSLGLRLVKRSTNILGRRGDIPTLSYIANPGIVLPYKFSEYAEAAYNIKVFIKIYDLLARKERYKLLLKLAEPEEMDLSFIKLKKAYKDYNDILLRLFQFYLISGGYPLIVYEYLIKNDAKNIDKKWYGEFAKIMLEDLKYVPLKQDIAEYILDYIQGINEMSPLIDLDKLETVIRARANLSKRDLTRFRIEDYIDYFNGVYTILKAVDIFQIVNPRDSIDKKVSITRRIKLFITDPFIFHAINLRETASPFEYSKEFVKDSSKSGVLVEHVVCSHFLRLPKHILYYYIKEEGGRTIGEIDCIPYYYKRYIPVEVKFIDNERKLREYAEKSIDILKDLNIDSRPIIVSKDFLEIEDYYAIIPAPIFLLLF